MTAQIDAVRPWVLLGVGVVLIGVGVLLGNAGALALGAGMVGFKGATGG